jgi:hypothetical protein
MSTYGYVFRHLELLPRQPDGFQEKLEAKIKDEASNHHDWDVSNDHRANHHDAASQCR